MHLQAIDQLGAACPASESAAADLAATSTPERAPRTWHARRMRRVAARQQPDEARTPAALCAASDLAGAMYARVPRACSGARRSDTLSADPNDNVREAALAALIDLKRPEAAAVAITQLSRPDYQLIITAARALEDQGNATKATTALFTALGRITKEHKETSRDPRMAILNRLQSYGDASQAVNLEGYLKDFDPAIARKAAQILTAWTGRQRTASPEPLTPRPCRSTYQNAGCRTHRPSAAEKPCSS